MSEVHCIGCGSLPHSTGLKFPFDHASSLCQVDFERSNLKHTVLVTFSRLFHVFFVGGSSSKFPPHLLVELYKCLSQIRNEIHSGNAVEINWTSEPFFFFFAFTHFCCDEPNFLIKMLISFSRLYLSIRSHQCLP